MSTIREQIISAITTRAEIIRTANGFNTDAGSNAIRARKNLDPSELPAVVIFPQREEVESRKFGVESKAMPIRIEAHAVFGSTDPSVISEQLLGDLIEAFTGVDYSLPFTGGTTALVTGETVTGGTSGATGYIVSVTVTSGTLASCDAAGILTIRRLTGTFSAETLKISGTTSASTTGIISGQSAITLSTAGLAESIEYASGGADDYPEAGDTIVGVSAIFNVKYKNKSGNPYNQ